jgi:glutamine amidotransferase
MIGIIDYGMGNLGSVANAFNHLGIEAKITDRPERLSDHDRLVLPGVGSFQLAMEKLDASGWSFALREQVNAGVPLLGICLGMQLIFDEGEEHGTRSGLGLIAGKVMPLQPSELLRVPHVGWNGLSYARRHPLFSVVKEHVDFYFVHSYQCCPTYESDVLAYCDYGGKVVAAVGRANVVGVQFHPEKSQDMGLKILENFAVWDGTC